MNEMRIFTKENSQSGQALVEIVLLTVIAIALILGLANQFYKPFSDWVKNSMGPYVECLLDAGVLPSLGDSNASSVCVLDKLKKVAGNPSPSSPNPAKPNSPSPKDNTSSEQVRKTSDMGTSSSSSNSSSSSSASSRKFKSNSMGGADGARSSENDKQIVESLPASNYFKLRSQGGNMTLSSGARSTAEGAIIVPMSKPRAVSGGLKTSKIATGDDESSGSQAKKLIVKPPERKPASEEPDQPWSFAQYIKFALILVIIIAIVLFLGGQILQISKSMEK